MIFTQKYDKFLRTSRKFFKEQSRLEPASTKIVINRTLICVMKSFANRREVQISAKDLVSSESY